MSLHQRLIAKQSDAELRRKKERAWRRAIWTQEDIDYAEREADRMLLFFNSKPSTDAEIQMFDKALIASSEFLYELKA